MRHLLYLSGIYFLGGITGAWLVAVIRFGFGVMVDQHIYHQVLLFHSGTLLHFWSPIFQLLVCWLVVSRKETLTAKPPWFHPALLFGSIAIWLLWSYFVVRCPSGQLVSSKYLLTCSGDGSWMTYIAFYIVVLVCSLGTLVHVYKEAKKELSPEKSLYASGSLALLVTLMCLTVFSLFLVCIQYGWGEEVGPESRWRIGGHLTLQGLTAAMFLAWQFLVNRLGALSMWIRLRKVAFWLYPVFAVYAGLYTLHEAISNGGNALPWFNSFVLLPALASLILGLALLGDFELSLRNRSGKMLRHPLTVAIAVGVLFFALLGGLSGMRLLDSSTAARWSSSLMMPAHFHALFLGGIALSYLSIKSLSLHERTSRRALISFAAGVAALVMGLYLEGVHGEMRRYTSEPPHISFSNAVGLVGATICGLVIGFIVVRSLWMCKDSAGQIVTSSSSNLTPGVPWLTYLFGTSLLLSIIGILLANN